MSIGTSTHLAPSEHKTKGLYRELEHIQEKYGYIPAPEMQKVAESRGLAIRHINAVASFYPHFRLKPRESRVEVSICHDLSCHLRHSQVLTYRLMRRFGMTDPKELSFKNVSCLGRCDQAPVFAVNDCIFQGIDEHTIVEMVRDAMAGRPLPRMTEMEYPRTLKSDPYSNPSQQYAIVRNLAKDKNFDEIIATLKSGGLRGMGGAGFPTNIKWDLVRNTPGKQKYVVCNADESEPGTFKDRVIMQSLPHLVVEGIIIAALCVGATKGWIYIRHEYEAPREALQREIDRCYKEHLLGKNILGSGLSFDLEIFVSPGGYICGEISAMLEAMEGKRAEPRDKPPGTGTHGLWRKPSVLNNVETFAFATTILANGPEWFKEQGTSGAVGLKFVGVSGHVNDPGVFEVPMGTTYRELIEKYAGGVLNGKKLLGFAPSGPSSGFLPAAMVDMSMDWQPLQKVGSMLGSAAVVVCAEGTCMLDMALNAVRFFRNESCGKCVPCRVGSQKMVELLTRWTNGAARDVDKELLAELSDCMKNASICGLGQIAPVPIESVLKHFPEQIEAHLQRRECAGGVCFQGDE